MGVNEERKQKGGSLLPCAERPGPHPRELADGPKPGEEACANALNSGLS